MAMESHKLCRNSDLLIDLDAEEKYAFPLLYEIDELEQRLYDLEKTLKQAEENEQSLLEELTNLQEFQSVLEGSFLFLSGTERIFLPSALYCFPDNKCDSGSPALRFGCIAGVIELSKKTSFERLLWRICRGSAFLRICNSQSLGGVQKSVFVVFFQGTLLGERIRRACDGFGAKLYACPESANERSALLKHVKTSLYDLEMVLQRTVDHKLMLLTNIKERYEGWFVALKKPAGQVYLLCSKYVQLRRHQLRTNWRGVVSRR
ncbi:V-type proton ATPase 116 kDa subunit a 1-like [Zophobas morio]|uniref:V-type proton ATPase 116 kDa subunit a 1-like n=1 Tax=Zophobas morio TaxID=2755281 RepID=UPI003083956A